MPHLQFLQLETNFNMLCLVFFFFGDFGMVFIVVCVFGFEFLAGFRSCCCRCWVCCDGSAGFVCLNTQDINWKRKSIFIEWRINQIKLHTAFSLNTKPTLITPPKTKQSHSQFQKHPFAQEKKKVQQLNKTQMRKLKWDCPIERERERERERESFVKLRE